MRTYIIMCVCIRNIASMHVLLYQKVANRVRLLLTRSLSSPF